MPRSRNVCRPFRSQLLPDFLNERGNWASALISLPRLPVHRLQHARNSTGRDHDSNELLEFIGDRVVNLACALMTEKVKFCPDQMVVRVLFMLCWVVVLNGNSYASGLLGF